MRRYLERQLAKLKESQRLASKGEIEAVHALRVASRRLEEPLAICRMHIDARIADRVAKQLKRVRRAFRVVRDLDVLQHMLAHDRQGLSAPHLERTQESLSVLRSDHLRKAIRKADRDRLQSITKSLKEVIRKLEDLEHRRPAWVHEAMKKLVARRAAQVLEPPAAGQAEPDLHRIRVGLKRLRYAVECMESITGRDMMDVTGQFKAAQDRLGEWNDHLQAVRRMTKLARRRASLIRHPDSSAALLEYAVVLLARSRGIAGEFVASWAELQAAVQPLAAAHDEDRKNGAACQ